MREGDLKKKLLDLVDKYPGGREDKKLLSGIIDEVVFRFCGVDLFAASKKDMLEMNAHKLKELIRKTIGLEQEKDIFKSSDKLKKYDYHEFFAPRLYHQLVRIESALIETRDGMSEFFKFIHMDHSEYLDALVEKTFEKNHDEIAKEMGLKIETKEDYFEARKLFSAKVDLLVRKKYDALIDAYKKRMNEGAGASANEILRFNRVKDLLRKRIESLDILRGQVLMVRRS